MKKGYSVEKEFLSKVGEKVKLYRTKKQLTLQELGEDIGLDKGNTKRLEKGKNMTLLTLFKIAAILEVDTKDLLDFPLEFNIQDVEKFIQEKKEGRQKKQALLRIRGVHSKSQNNERKGQTSLSPHLKLKIIKLSIQKITTQRFNRENRSKQIWLLTPLPIEH
jgi:transcriptional regulator with XRE-family HTH domain